MERLQCEKAGHASKVLLCHRIQYFHISKNMY